MKMKDIVINLMYIIILIYNKKVKSNKQGNFISNVANYVESTDFKSNYDHRDRYNKLG